MDQAVVIEHHRKTGQFSLVGEPAVDEQVDGLLEGGMFGQLFHGDTTVAKDAFFSIHEGDGAQATAGVGIPGVEVINPVSALRLDISMAFSPSLPVTTGSSISFPL